MSFRIIKNSTTADPNDVNNNFYHIMRGDFLPKGGDRLDYTDGVYDLGNTNYRWNDFHVNNVYASTTFSEETTWKLIADVYLSGTASTIQISGLDGEDVDEYMFFGRVLSVQTNSALYIILNEATSSSYSYFHSICPLTTITSDNQQGVDLIYLGNVALTGTGDNVFFFQTNFNTNEVGTGDRRPFLINYVNGAKGANIHEFRNIAAGWLTTGSTVSSIELIGGITDTFGTDTHVQLWGKS